MSHTGTLMCSLCLLALATSPALAAPVEEQTLALEDLPEAVQETINQHLGAGTIQEIELETEDGQTVYSVEILTEGKETEITVAPDGRFLGAEEEENDDEGDEDNDEEDEEDDN